MAGISRHSIAELPVAVVDVETTGLYPGSDRIVELAVVRVDPGDEPRLVLNTLVNPGRRVSATEIHGITDRDVADAPSFVELVPEVMRAFDSAVMASYNVYFDARFIESELSTFGSIRLPPHLCLMYLRPLLGLGSKCSLADACAVHGIDVTHSHTAASDAQASSELWRIYLNLLEDRGIDTFGDLARRKSYKFLTSFSSSLLKGSARGPRPRLKQRQGVRQLRPERSPLSEYWSALKAALSDLEVTDEEIAYLREKRRKLKLTGDQVRWLHARAFGGILTDVCADEAVTRAEAAVLHHINEGLRKVGWAPGDPPSRSRR